MDWQTRRTVRERADDRCEYCRLRQEHAPLWRHQIEPAQRVAFEIDGLVWHHPEAISIAKYYERV